MLVCFTSSATLPLHDITKAVYADLHSASTLKLSELSAYCCMRLIHIQLSLFECKSLTAFSEELTHMRIVCGSRQRIPNVSFTFYMDCKVPFKRSRACFMEPGCTVIAMHTTIHILTTASKPTVITVKCTMGHDSVTMHSSRYNKINNGDAFQ